MEDSTVVSCPACGKKYKISPDKLGRTFKCVGCQTEFQAGAAQEAPEAGPVELEFASPSSPAVPPPFDPSLTPPVMSYNTDGMGGQGGPKTSGMAIAALVCGILCCVPPCSLLAVIFGIIGITQTKPGQAKGRGMAITGVVLGGLYMLLIVPALLISILLPSLNKARETANRAKCASNMHQIGLAILLYQNENQQQYPPDLTTLWKNQQLNATVFICPESNDTPAVNPAQLETGGHCSYVYLYPQYNSRNPDATDVILYENASNHHNDGTNVLFGDGHAEWETPAEAKRLISETGKHSQVSP